MQKYDVSGRVRLLGTPAEEGGAGKVALIAAGAYDDVDACLMAHPAPSEMMPQGYAGHAYVHQNASIKIRVKFTGKPSHAAMAPWRGVNALDAVALSYNAISMLRQQTAPEERIRGTITTVGGQANVIPDVGSLSYQIRAPTVRAALSLRKRVEECFRGAATATGCGVSVETPIQEDYYDMRPNSVLIAAYAAALERIGVRMTTTLDTDNLTFAGASTDQGNVSYKCPSIHGVFPIPTAEQAVPHTAKFQAYSGTAEAFDNAMETARGLAEAGIEVLMDDEVYNAMRKEFDNDREREALFCSGA